MAKKMKVLVSDKLSDEGVKIMQDAGLEVDCKLKLSPDELKKIIGKYDAIAIRSGTTLTKDIIEKADNLKMIGRAGVGVDNVDVEAATKKGIIVMNAPGGNTISTCEQAWALLLAVARNTAFAHASMKEGKWDRAKFKGIELYSKTLGVIGFGRIGREVAKRAIAFGMDVLVMDPFVTQEMADKIGVKLADKETILKKSDFITIHAPLTDQTKNLISTKEFEMMKPKAYVINAARGGIVDEDALYEALKEKKIAGAALDVYSKEPVENLKLAELDNVILTPHLGASTEEAQLNVAIEIAHCLKDALAGKAIRNAVNYAQLDQETYRVIGPYFNLAENMGKFIAQLVQGGLKEMQINYLGEISQYKVDALSAALVTGFLLTQLESDINYINALEIAKERGIKIEQIKALEEEEFVNSIKVKVITDKEQRTLEGTLFANKDARFVKLDDVYLETAPSEHMLVINNEDKPGVVGFVGTTLGKHKVNIAGMSLGRKDQKTALTIFNLDNPLTDAVKKEISADSRIISLKPIKL